MTTGGQEGAVREEYAALAPEYDRRWARYVEASSRETFRRTRLGPGERLLDVGCGTGTLLALFARRDPEALLAGVDLAVEMLGVARAKLGASVPLVVADALALPFADASLNVVTSCSSFHYWPNPDVGLAEVGRVLRPRGCLVLTDWCDDFLTCRVCDLALRVANRAHRRAYGAHEVVAMLEGLGFRDVMVDRYKITWLWGLMTVRARAPERSRRAAFG
jgi:ubiquinone/menaquinone biosynthesis C-methylase UbiE